VHAGIQERRHRRDVVHDTNERTSSRLAPSSLQAADAPVIGGDIPKVRTQPVGPEDHAVAVGGLAVVLVVSGDEGVVKECKFIETKEGESA
jgi:hypothetical protein